MLLICLSVRFSVRNARWTQNAAPGEPSNIGMHKTDTNCPRMLLAASVYLANEPQLPISCHSFASDSRSHSPPLQDIVPGAHGSCVGGLPDWAWDSAVFLSDSLFLWSFACCAGPSFPISIVFTAQVSTVRDWREHKGCRPAELTTFTLHVAEPAAWLHPAWQVGQHMALGGSALHALDISDSLMTKETHT